MATSHDFSLKNRDSWLEQCVEIVRDAVLARRAATCRSMSDAIQQAARDLSLSPSRAKAFFYREVLFVTPDQWSALKAAATGECDARVQQMSERTAAARASRRQHEIELREGRPCGFSGNGRGSAAGGGIDA